MSARFRPELERLDRSGLLRQIRDRQTRQGRLITVAGRECVNFSSNDYLGLASDPVLKKAALRALEEYGAGSGASRLLSGGTTLHRRLEEAVAEFKGTEDAVLFNSGYSANTGIIPAMAGEGDEIFSDELNHASIVDGCRLSKAETRIYRHADPDHLAALLRDSVSENKLVVTDSVFSMDGDIAPLGEIHSLCTAHGAVLYVDDAHGTGVLGEGRGAFAHFGLLPGPWTIQMGTFSKALGSFGAFAAAGKDVISYIVNKARTLIFSTALPAHVAGASLASLDIVGRGEAPIGRLWANRALLASRLDRAGIGTARSQTPIIPVFARTPADALKLAEELLKVGVYAPAIRPPAVGRPRIRLAVTAAHTEEDIGRLADVLEACLALIATP